MKRYSLKVEKRKVLGKKVKKLRRDGIIPGNIYGKDIKSQAVQIPAKDFTKVYEEAGETGLVDVSLDSQVIPVLIHNVHTNYRDDVLHADFFKVNLKEKVKTMVPIEFMGEAKAEIDKIGLLEKIMSELEVEALPTELPENIPVNVAHLSQIDQQITVGNLKPPAEITILSDEALVIAKIGELISKEAQEQMAQEAAAAEAAAAESATEEGAVPAEGEEVPAEGEAPTTEAATLESTDSASEASTAKGAKSPETQSKGQTEQKPQK